MDVEQMSYSTGRAVARLSDGVVLSERFSLTDACVEHIEATQPQIELTPSIAESIGELRTSENIENVRVLSADVHHALVVVTPRPEVAAEAGGDWSQPTEPFLLTIPARTGATVQ